MTFVSLPHALRCSNMLRTIIHHGSRQHRANLADAQTKSFAYGRAPQRALKCKVLAAGSSGKQTENSAQTSKASSSTADDAAATTSSAKTKEEGGMDDASIHAEPELAQDVQGQTDKQLQETASAEQPEQLNPTQPAVDDWGDFVS